MVGRETEHRVEAVVCGISSCDEVFGLDPVGSSGFSWFKFVEVVGRPEFTRWEIADCRCHSVIEVVQIRGLN